MNNPPSKQMRTFSFDGEGIYEMPEGVGEYVLASEARAEIERLRAICAAAYQMAGAYDAPVRFLDALALHDEYLEMTPDQIIDALLPVDVPDEIEKLRYALEMAARRFEYIAAGVSPDIANAPTGAQEAREALALHVIDEAGKLSDWINRARPAIAELMEAYARLVRSHSGMGAMELADVQPWRCMEYIGAEELLRAQPVAIVEITAEKAGESHGD